MTELERITGVVTTVTGGYAVTAVTGGFGRTFGELILFLAGLVVAGYGLVTVTNASRRLAAWNGPVTAVAGCGLAVVQWLVAPTGGFSGDELWNANPGSADGLYVLAGMLVALGLGTVLSPDSDEQ